MIVEMDGLTFDYPGAPGDITLGAWVAFVETEGKRLDGWRDKIEELPEGTERSLQLQEYDVEHAYAIAAHFAGVSREEALERFKLGPVRRLFRDHFTKAFNIAALNDPNLQVPPVISWNGTDWILPPADLSPEHPLTFGEFIDAKVLLDEAKQTGATMWSLALPLAAMFLRQRDEAYQEDHVRPGSERMSLFEALPLEIAAYVSVFFERLNRYADEHFSVFHPGVGNPGRNMKAHMQRWGWINFLTGISKTKIFDIPGLGLNSIECVRRASCYEVLVYASQEKDYLDAWMADNKIK